MTTTTNSTHLLSTRVDCRHLAALATYWATKGSPPRSVSDLARLSLEGLASLLVSGGKVSLPTYSEALAILERLGLNTKTNKETLIRALHQEDLQLDSTPLAAMPPAMPLAAMPPSADYHQALRELEERLGAPTVPQTLLDLARNQEFKDSLKEEQG